jgi:hypothetical protein
LNITMSIKAAKPTDFGFPLNITIILTIETAFIYDIDFYSISAPSNCANVPGPCVPLPHSYAIINATDAFLSINKNDQVFPAPPSTYRDRLVLEITFSGSTWGDVALLSTSAKFCPSMLNKYNQPNLTFASTISSIQPWKFVLTAAGGPAVQAQDMVFWMMFSHPLNSSGDNELQWKRSCQQNIFCDVLC